MTLSVEPVLTVLIFSALAAAFSAAGVLPFSFRADLPLRWIGWAYALASGLMLGAGYLLMVEGLVGRGWPVILGGGLGVAYTWWTHRYSGTGELETRPASEVSFEYGYKVILLYAMHSASEGVAIGVAMEGGFLEFGDAKGALDLMRQMAEGTPVGRILGQGAAFTGRAFGVTRVPVVKGQAMPAYEPRAVKGIGVTYATSTMGADHTSGYTIAPEILSVGGTADPFAVNKAELSRAFQATTAFIDSSGYCLFIAFAILDDADGFQGMIDTVNGMLGTGYDADGIVEYGHNVLKVERGFNAAAGFTKADDRLPEFMKLEKLPPHDVVWDVPDEELDKVHAY